MTLCHACGLPILAEQCGDHHPACPNRHHPNTVDCTCPPAHPWCCDTCKETPMSAAHQCEVCGHTPRWTILRDGDAVVSWACPTHVSDVCDRMQRDHEVTELVVTLTPKAHEWAEIGELLRKVEP